MVIPNRKLTPPMKSSCQKNTEPESDLASESAHYGGQYPSPQVFTLRLKLIKMK